MKKKKFVNLINNIPIKTKLFITYGLVFLLIISVSFTALFFQIKSHLKHEIEKELRQSNRTIADMVETSATVSIKNHLRTIAKKNEEILGKIYEQSQNQLISETTAKQMAIDILLSQTVGKTGYIYSINSSGVVEVHPKKSVKGRDLSDKQFVRIQMKEKNGYLEYDWENPGDIIPRSKALYMTYFEPWDWIISVSSYKSEFDELINIADFEPHISNLKFGKTGYNFIIDTAGNTVIHPELSGSLIGLKEAQELSFAHEMLKKKKGYLTYHWKNPSDNKAREKFVAFDYIPSYNWIVASSAFSAEVFQPLVKTRNAFIGILVVSILLTVGVTMVIGSSITRPLSAVIKRFEKVAHGDWSSRIPVERQDEVGKLSSGFNRFLDQLDIYRQSLISEICVREKAENQVDIFEKVFENTTEGICITDERGDIQAVNRAFTDITGYASAEAIGENPRILKSDRHDDAFYEEMWQDLTVKGFWSGEIWNRRKNGEAYPELLSINAIKEDTHTKKYVSVFHDISDMKVKEQQIQHMAYHDPLTNLPNRVLFKDRLNQAISVAARSDEKIQILYLDLDNFKKVNDSVGHVKGDELLKDVAGRLLTVIQPGDTVSRLGGDEFTLMIRHQRSYTDVAKMVERVQAVFEAPFCIGDHCFHITASIGIAMFPNDGNDGDTLIKNADLAMYQTKYLNKNDFSIFEQKMAEKVIERVNLEQDLRAGIENDEFLVYFQPRVDAHTSGIMGMEALVRWNKPGTGIVPPNKFIPLAEESGLIIPLGEKIFYNSIRQAKEIRETTGVDLSVSVNVSTRQFEDPDFEAMIIRILKETGFPNNRLEIEITESLLVKDIKTTLMKLKGLSNLGVSTAIDDFGTGYSSLSYIRMLPISVLKIDKTFIDDLPHNKDAGIIVETTVLMAQKLNIGIVAEGVETEEQLRFLSKLGQMEIQGYLFAKPMEKCELENWIEERKADERKMGQNKLELLIGDNFHFGG